MDLIERQAAIDAILTEVDEIDMPNVEPRWWNMGMMRASKILEHLPSTQQWILCSESLPEEGENVLITDEDGYVVLADYARYSWEADPIVWYSDGCHVKPVAWMPLPEAYKGEGNG